MSGITDADLYKCEELLQETLGWHTMPDAVWGRLSKDGYVTATIREGYEGHEWDQLKAKAREFGREARESDRETNLPPEGRERAPSQFAGARLDDYTTLRAEVFSEVAGALANRWTEVRKFRDIYLGGTDARLTNAEAGAWLYRREAPENALTDLAEMSRRLSRVFRWRIGDANWFVLTGYVPFVRPVSVFVRNTNHRDAPSYLNRRYYLEGSEVMVDTAEIVITAEPWVDSRIIARAFKEVQKQVRGGDNRKITAKTLNAVRFIARHLGADKIRWPELRASWNQAQPEMRYNNRNDLYGAFQRFLHPKYKSPRFPDYEPTPWQEAERAEHQRRLEHSKAVAERNGLAGLPARQERPEG